MLGYTSLREVSDDKLQGVRVLMALPISMHHYFPLAVKKASQCTQEQQSGTVTCV